MSALHVLERDGEQYRCVAHQPIPAGNNSAGVSWKNVVLAAGLNVTVLAEGNLPGQITAIERGQVAAGDVLEAVFTIPLFSGGSANAQIDAMALAEFNKWRDVMIAKYTWFGKVRP